MQYFVIYSYDMCGRKKVKVVSEKTYQNNLKKYKHYGYIKIYNSEKKKKAEKIADEKRKRLY